MDYAPFSISNCFSTQFLCHFPSSTIVRKLCWHKMPTVQMLHWRKKSAEKKNVETILEKIESAIERGRDRYRWREIKKKSKIKEIFESSANNRATKWRKVESHKSKSTSKLKDLNVQMCVRFALTHTIQKHTALSEHHTDNVEIFSQVKSFGAIFLLYRLIWHTHYDYTIEETLQFNPKSTNQNKMPDVNVIRNVDTP